MTTSPAILAPSAQSAATRDATDRATTGASTNGAGGSVMIGVGVLMMTGRLQEIAIWMLMTFPMLGAIG